MDLYAAVPVDFAGLSHLRFNGHHPPQDRENRLGVLERGEEDIALFNARRIRSFVVHKLPRRRTRNSPQLQPSPAEREVCVDLTKRTDMLRPRQERPRLPEVLVPGLQLYETPSPRLHGGGVSPLGQEDSRRRQQTLY